MLGGLIRGPFRESEEGESGSMVGRVGESVSALCNMDLRCAMLMSLHESRGERIGGTCCCCGCCCGEEVVEDVEEGGADCASGTFLMTCEAFVVGG